LRATKWNTILGEEEEVLGSKRDKAMELNALNQLCDVSRFVVVRVIVLSHHHNS
jgi:hypothetical protein